VSTLCYSTCTEQLPSLNAGPPSQLCVRNCSISNPLIQCCTVAAVCCGSSKRSRCKLMRQSVLGSDNETKAIYGQRMIICQAASNHLGCGVGRATELSLRQQQLQKHRPPRIPATISCFPKSGQEAPSQPDWIRDTNLWEGCTYDLISLQRIRLHCCTARAISLRLQVPH
jgi:hypothetical protein